MNLKLFKKRLERFYSSWKKQKERAMARLRCNRNRNAAVWFRHHQLLQPGINVLLLVARAQFPRHGGDFHPGSIYFLCTKKANSRLQALVAPTLDLEAVHAQLFVVAKEKGNASMAQMDQIIQEISVSRREALKGASDPLVVGYVEGERPRSELLWRCEHDMINPAKYRTACVNAGLVKLFNREEVQINI